MKLTEYLTKTPEQLGIKLEPYHLIQRGGKVLAVAHCDTVQDLPKRGDIVIEKNRIWSPCLDDRLGVWLIMENLWDLGMDVLLTDDEEKCASTAQFVDQEILDSYNWIVEFDRGGNDVVTYGIESAEWLEALELVDFEIGMGSFSDIASMHTNRCAVNIGIGYRHAHSKKSWANIPELQCQMRKFREFYELFSDVQFDSDNPRNGKAEQYWRQDENCEWCGELLLTDAEIQEGLCRYCTGDKDAGVDEYLEYERVQRILQKDHDNLKKGSGKNKNGMRQKQGALRLM